MEERLDAYHELQRLNSEQFFNIFYLPFVQGISGKPDVMMGDRYNGYAISVPQDIWLDR